MHSGFPRHSPWKPHFCAHSLVTPAQLLAAILFWPSFSGSLSSWVDHFFPCSTRMWIPGLQRYPKTRAQEAHSFNPTYSVCFCVMETYVCSFVSNYSCAFVISFSIIAMYLEQDGFSKQFMMSSWLEVLRFI